MGTLQPGQRVKFLNDVGSATVVRIEGATVVVEDEDGFERSVDHAELLIARPGRGSQAIRRHDSGCGATFGQGGGEAHARTAKDFEVRYQNAQATSMARRDAHMEVDLHIHELVDDQSGLPDRAKLAIQMDHFDRMMDIAKREKLRRIVFIHGVGQGVLRHQIRTSLEQHHPDCSYREGDPRRYGSGATEVWLGQASWRKPE